MQNAVAYIRVSSQRQVEEGGSLETQTKQVESFAAKNDLNLVRIFREAGESAKTDQRPQLQEMLRFIRSKEHGVNVVIVPKIDRLARNVADYLNLKLQITRLEIRIESLGERIEDTPTGRFSEALMASLAQLDNEIRSERSKGGMDDAVAEGRWVWKAPVGYRNVRPNGKGTIEPHPEHAPLIQRAFHQLATGHQSAKAVRAFLDQDGIRLSRNGFYKLIQNEIYIGRIHAFGKIALAQPPFVPLVDEETFHRARKNLKPTNVPQQYQMESSDFPLRGSMKCACGRLFTASWSRGEYGKRYPYYRCMSCQRKSFKREAVDTEFERFLAIFKGRADAWDRLERKILEFDESIRKQHSKDHEMAEKRIEEIQQLRDAIAIKNAKGVLPDDLATRQIGLLTEELAQVMSEKGQEPAQPKASDVMIFARSFFFDLDQTWHKFTIKTKKDLLRFMFPKGILFDPERGFRTSDSPLTERLIQAVSGDLSSMVDPSAEFSNFVHSWLSTLYSIARSDSCARPASTVALATSLHKQKNNSQPGKPTPNQD